MDIKKKVAIAGTSAVMAVGLGIGAAQFAAADPTGTPSPNPTSTSTSTSTPTSGQTRNQGDSEGRGRHGQGDGEQAKLLAEKLGLDESKVSTALQEAHEALRGDDDFRNLTPEQRDAALAKQLATKLGVDESKVKTALDELRTARQAEAKTAFKTRLDQAVKDGKLTQTEADAVMKAAEQGVIGMGGGRGPGR